MKLIIPIFLIVNFVSNFSKGADPVFAIKLNNPDPVQYCTMPVQVAKDLTVEGTPKIVGMKISFTQGYIAGEDELIYSGTKLVKSNPASGTLLLTGSTVIQDYIDAIRTITYKNNNTIPTLGIRKITISLDDVDYLPETAHFYRYISKPGITWTNARDEAASTAMIYYGLKGYLATITSQAENDFIKSKTTGVGWIGASDAGVEGEWRWVTGPESSNGGLLFWKGTGYQAKSNPANFGAVNSAYHNWNRWNTPYSTSLATTTWEPNQSGEEDYAHITVFPANLNDSYKWNDLPNAGGNGDYASKGYLIEWGGSPGEQVLNLSATLDLQVNTMTFKTAVISPICEGDTIRLNQADSNTIPGIYSWSPVGSLSNGSVSNPVASPLITTSYTVSGTRGICTNSALFTVPVNPRPVSLLKTEENICKGSQITLDPGDQKSYLWSNGATTRTITIATAGDYKVTLNSVEGCSASSTTRVIVHEFPVIDFSKLDTLICGDPRATLVNISTNGAGFSLISSDNKAIVAGLNVTVPVDGVYPMVYKTAIYASCVTVKNFELSFFKLPGDDMKLKPEYNICAGDQVTLDPGLFKNYVWSNNAVTPTISVDKTGDYSVKLTTDKGCSAPPFFTKVIVHDYPTIDLSKVQTLICGDPRATLVNVISNGTTYALRSSNGNATVNGLNVSAPVDGVCPMIYKASIYSSCFLEKTFDLSFYKSPKDDLQLKPEYNICAGDQVILDPGTYKSYNWNNSEITRTISVDKTGDYSVILTTDKGCSAPPFNTKVIVHDYPIIDLSKIDSLICGDPRSTTVNISTNGDVEYSFLTSIDSKVLVNNRTVKVEKDGVYPMMFKTAIYSSCVSKRNFNLSFYKIPEVDFTINAKKCSGYNLDVSYVGDATPDVSNFKWDFGGEIIANGTGINNLIVPLGINRLQRDLTLTVTEDGCSNTYVEKNILVIPNLDLTIIDSLGCESFNAEFKASNTEVVNYDWDFGDGTPVERKDNHPFHLYQKAGFYDVKLKVTTIVPGEEGCSNEVKIDSMVHVAPIPDVAFSLSEGDCLNRGVNEISYTGKIGTVRDTYEWKLEDFDLSEIISDPTQTKGPLRFDLKTKPLVNLGLKVVSEFGCESILKSISIKRQPDFSIASDVWEGCIPFEPSLSGEIIGTDKVDKVDFTWDFGDGTTGAGSPLSHLYNIPDKRYSLTLVGKSLLTECSDTMNIKDSVRTYPKPVAAFSLDHNIVYNDQPKVIFTNSSLDADHYLWDFGDKLTSSEKNPSHSYAVTGYQKVLLDVSNLFNCNDTVSHSLMVAMERIFPPNGFSPNAPDPVDREFRLYSVGVMPEDYHFTIFSRWNDVVFEVKDEIVGWDGRMKNGDWAPSGSYVWVLYFTDFLGRKHRQTGSVTLVF